MNINVASQNQGRVAWLAVAAPGPSINPAIDLRHHNNFSFTFHVVTDIAVDAVFEFAAAPPDPANPCVPLLPQHKVQDVPTCTGAASVGDVGIVVPAGTKAGSICTATLPCKPDAFIQIEPASGDTGNIDVVVTLSGPR